MLIPNFVKKWKFLNLGPKMPYLGIFELKSEKKKLYGSNLGFFNVKFSAKIKILKLGIKIALFGYFWAVIWKKCCHTWNQHPRNRPIARFCEKMKMLQFGTKNVLFRYFWAEILKWYCLIWNQHPRSCLTAKFH